MAIIGATAAAERIPHRPLDGEALGMVERESAPVALGDLQLETMGAALARPRLDGVEQASADAPAAIGGAQADMGDVDDAAIARQPTGEGAEKPDDLIAVERDDIDPRPLLFELDGDEIVGFLGAFAGWLA